MVKVVAIPANQLKDIDKATPLTLVADEDGFIIVTFNNGIVLANDIHYSINGGAEQTIAKNTEGEYKIAVSKGDFVQFWSTNTALGGGGGGGAASRALTRAVDSGAKYINIRPSMKTEIYGNVMSLLKGKDGLEGATALEAKNAFYGLFAGAEKLVNNAERLLVLPATTLTEGCYQDMFNGCKGIEKAPELPAPKLEKNCYQEMFYDCAKLNSVRCLATDISAENSTKDWLGKAGTEATGPKVLETATDDLKHNSDDGIPTDWLPKQIVLVESVTLGKTELALVINEADVTLTATVKPDDATDKTVTWTSSNPAVATVTATTDNTKGTVHAVAAGEATITATAGDKTATCKVTVTEKPKAIDLSTVTENTVIEDGLTVTGTLKENVKISIADGATVTLDGVTINGVNNSSYKWAGITCEGDATIILKDGTTNTVKGFYERYPGIYVPENKKLTINDETKGTGKLTASSNGGGAGIGGAYSINCGNIEIQGGVITATGSSNAAGIGGANSSSCGTITISGGTVTATCGANAAGIGSGYCGNCVDIIITGGSVTATGGGEGAGIGSGYQGKCGDILISGGTIEATGGTDAAGIGSGYDNSASCGDITISGGTVKATGGSGGAGIGSGYFGSCVDITISGGTVTATGRDEGAGIGSSFDGKCGNIMITSGVKSVTATKGSDSPNSIGIGAGNDGTCGTVTIGGKETGNITTSPYTYPAPEVGGVKVDPFAGGGDPLKPVVTD